MAIATADTRATDGYERLSRKIVTAQLRDFLWNAKLILVPFDSRVRRVKVDIRRDEASVENRADLRERREECGNFEVTDIPFHGPDEQLVIPAANLTNPIGFCRITDSGSCKKCGVKLYTAVLFL